MFFANFAVFFLPYDWLVFVGEFIFIDIITDTSKSFYLQNLPEALTVDVNIYFRYVSTCICFWIYQLQGAGKAEFGWILIVADFCDAQEWILTTWACLVSVGNKWLCRLTTDSTQWWYSSLDTSLSPCHCHTCLHSSSWWCTLSHPALHSRETTRWNLCWKSEIIQMNSSHQNPFDPQLKNHHGQSSSLSPIFNLLISHEEHTWVHISFHQMLEEDQCNA